jgi:DNA-binding CsgD family transcriptional regulator
VRAERASLAAEIVREIRRHIPEFDRPLTGRFGAGIQLGAETALREFTDLITGDGRTAEERRRVYRALGRGELIEGRSLDALQAAYRLGARVAWRRYARIARRMGMEPEMMITLAEAVFAHIDEIASASVVGYADAKAEAASSIDRRRRHLLEMLVSGTAAADIARAAAEAQWTLPDQVACAALTPPSSGTPRSQVARWPAEALADLDRPDPFVMLPDPAALLREPQTRQALQFWSAVVGPTVPLAMAPDSLRWARKVRDRLPDQALRGGPVLCDRHLAALLLLGDEPLVRLLGDRRLAALADLTVKQRRRLESTLLVWLATSRGSASEVAARLGVHPQTARQRMRRIQALFGDVLADPEARFELEVALRGRVLPTEFTGSGWSTTVGC